MVDEVHAHMKEMLKVGAIHPGQSPWCNASVLVCKKKWRPAVLYQPLQIKYENQNRLLSAPPETRGYWEPCFSCLDWKAGFWQIAMDNALKQQMLSPWGT